MAAQEMFPHQDLKTALRRLELTSYAVQEVHTELDKPQDPEEKADLLIATENLASEVIDLLHTVRVYVWGINYDEEVYSPEE